MKTLTAAQAVSSPSAIAKLGEIQEEMRHMCQPHYDEFHKTTVEHGFVKITIPQKRRA